jgi:hypothetical protein
MQTANNHMLPPALQNGMFLSFAAVGDQGVLMLKLGPVRKLLYLPETYRAQPTVVPLLAPPAHLSGGARRADSNGSGQLAQQAYNTARDSQGHSHHGSGSPHLHPQRTDRKGAGRSSYDPAAAAYGQAPGGASGYGGWDGQEGAYGL